MKKSSVFAYIFLAFLYSFSTLVEENIFPSLILQLKLNHWLIKILPMLLLIFISFKQIKNKHHVLFMFGLIFSTLGDFLLAYDGLHWFIYGLAAFLIAHLFYLYSFMPLQIKKIQYIAAYILYGFVMLSILLPKLGNLEFPVVLYMVVLMSMAISTLASKSSNFWLILGGVMFVLSDSLLGFNKFHTQFSYSHILIISTYYLAQYALVKGLLFENINYQESLE